MKAMVLAAGLGTRLNPITRWIPKPMMPVFGIPIIELVLKQLRDHGVQEVIINLHHHPVQLIEHLKDGSSLGIEITYSFEPHILGTAGGIKKVEHDLQDGPFLVVNADTYRCVDLHGLLQHHLIQRPLLTMVLQENPKLEQKRAVWIDDRGDVSGFLDLYRRSDGLPARPTDFLGIQVMEPEVLSHIPAGQPWEMQRVYVELLRSGRPISGYLHRNYWMDLGTLDRYRQLHKDALDGQCPVEIPGHEQESGIWTADGVHLDPAARIHPPVCIGVGCRVRGSAQIGPYAVLGRSCTVQTGARIVRSILWDGVRIDQNAVVEDCLVSRTFHCSLSSRTEEKG